MSNRKKKLQAPGKLLEQLINITDITLRNARDTATQREALALKELLEGNRRKVAS